MSQTQIVADLKSIAFRAFFVIGSSFFRIVGQSVDGLAAYLA
jgi:hypothetical protein